MSRPARLARATLVLSLLSAGLSFGVVASATWSGEGVTESRSAPATAARPDPVRAPLVLAASPVPPYIRLASGFGYRSGRRTHRPTFHAGADFPAPEGTPVFAARAGRVVRVVTDSPRTIGFRGYGNAIVLHHPGDESWTLYAHLRETRAREGEQVVAGAPIGSVGATSNGRFGGMGSHLHFEVRHRRADGGIPFPGPYRANNVDPRRWLAARGVVFGANGLVAPIVPFSR